jgi:hypothetical protein
MPDDMRTILLYLYRQRVDCLYKILHWPTVLEDLAKLPNEAQDRYKSSAMGALELSIYFISLCSITNDEARNLGLGERALLIERYRGATERALSEAGLLQQPNLTVLQAFVIYLVLSAQALLSFAYYTNVKTKIGHRTFYNTATWWTLLAVAVRVGTALRLGQENPRVTPRERELRRRLWYCIALMDTHGSFDRGAPPILRWEDLGPQPLLLSDIELSQTVVPDSSSSGFNDMSFFALMFRAMLCQKKMASVSDSVEDGWAARLQLVRSFEDSIKQDYCNVSEDAPPFEKFTEQVAKGIIASTHLDLRRPPYKQHHTLVPSWDNFDVLQHSTELLQQEMAIKSPEFAPWAWKSWVRWNALAIVLVELCSKPAGESFDVAYLVATQSFKNYSNLIADTEMGMLWKPITKLMRRFQQLKGSAHTSEQASSLGSGVDFGLPNHLTDSDFSTLNLDGHVENAYTSQNDQIMAMSEDAQINWFTFTDSINMDYPVSWDHALF